MAHRFTHEHQTLKLAGERGKYPGARGPDSLSLTSLKGELDQLEVPTVEIAAQRRTRTRWRGRCPPQGLRRDDEARQRAGTERTRTQRRRRGDPGSRGEKRDHTQCWRGGGGRGRSHAAGGGANPCGLASMRKEGHRARTPLVVSGWESACWCRGHGLDPWSGKIPRASEQLGPCATAPEARALWQEEPPR